MASTVRSPIGLFARAMATLAPVALIVAACADSTEAGPAALDDAGSSSDGGRGDDSDVSNDAAIDRGPQSTCELTRAYFEGCKNDEDLNCGAAGFDAWCNANDDVINSEAYRRAEALCLTKDNCDGKKRRACEYAHYNDETATTSQEALVASYCQTCEPSDIAGCTERSTKYDPAKGIDAVGDIFVAAWEFADAIVDEMKTTCTGSGVDAGADPAACAEAFATCAAEVYFAHLPDCPE